MRNYTQVGLGALVVAILFPLSQNNYLFFHSLVELFSVIVAFSLFMVSWNARAISSNPYLLFVGFGYVALGFLDLLHTLSYKGMAVFDDQEYHANQLWIIARFVDAVTLILGFYFHHKKIRPPALPVIGAYGVITVSACLSVFVFGNFPPCFVEGVGQTPFKIYSEYLIIALFGVALFLLWKARNEFESKVFNLLVVTILLTIASEFAFTIYVSNYGFSNFVGHILKLFSYGFLYAAVVKTAIREPYKLVFAELTQKNLELKKTLEELKEVRSLIPICAWCRKARSDAGYWGSIESYLLSHTNLEVSHGICPDCKNKHMPDDSNPVDNKS